MQIHAGGLIVLRHGENGVAERLARFLNANSHPFRTLDLSQSVPAQLLAEEKGVQESDLPAVVSAKGTLKQPPLRALAEKLGISDDVRQGVTWDVAVVGAGPSGLATAVYAASEGASNTRPR
jgi:thioredoxin reductase (NADPH)